MSFESRIDSELRMWGNPERYMSLQAAELHLADIARALEKLVRLRARVEGIDLMRRANPNWPECTCWPTAPQSWTRYGDAIEPGSTLEPDPDCVKHFPRGLSE